MPLTCIPYPRTERLIGRAALGGRQGNTCAVPNDRSPPAHETWKTWEQGRELLPADEGPGDSRQIAHSPPSFAGVELSGVVTRLEVDSGVPCRLVYISQEGCGDWATELRGGTTGRLQWALGRLRAEGRSEELHRRLQGGLPEIQPRTSRRPVYANGNIQKHQGQSEFEMTRPCWLACGLRGRKPAVIGGGTGRLCLVPVLRKYEKYRTPLPL